MREADDPRSQGLGTSNGVLGPNETPGQGSVEDEGCRRARSGAGQGLGQHVVTIADGAPDNWGPSRWVGSAEDTGGGQLACDGATEVGGSRPARGSDAKGRVQYEKLRHLLR